jgi:chromosome partitioning protein
LRTVGFFNVKSGVGKTTLVYHLAWMYQELGITTVVLDVDPQADLTADFLLDGSLMEVPGRLTIAETVGDLLSGKDPRIDLVDIGDSLTLLPGNLELGFAESIFAATWSKFDQENSLDLIDALRVLTAFYQTAQLAAKQNDAPLVLINIGPGINAINRAAILACDAIVVPLRTDLSSLHSVRPVGTALREWRSAWTRRYLRNKRSPTLAADAGAMDLIGYTILQLRAGLNEWVVQQLTEGLSALYHWEGLEEPEGTSILTDDRFKLAVMKAYPSLLALAQATHKPMFLLKPADGALGSLAEAVVDCYRDFKQLATRIAAACGIDIPH